MLLEQANDVCRTFVLHRPDVVLHVIPSFEQSFSRCLLPPQCFVCRACAIILGKAGSVYFFLVFSRLISFYRHDRMKGAP